MARQRLGQHFLTDAGWRERILRALRIAPAEAWLEIGAGHGEMTALLARHATRVIAVELDLRLVARLRTLAQRLSNLEVVAGDILALDVSRLASGAGATRLRVYGNLPYYITSPILHRLFQHAARIESVDAVMQFEVAARIVARPGRRQYGYLSVQAQFYARPDIVLRIPPGAFRPRPKVTSALVHLSMPGERARLSVPDDAKFLEFVKRCFEQKRKTLLNNLSSIVPRERAAELIAAAGLRRDARAEQLSVAQFAELFRRL